MCSTTSRSRAAAGFTLIEVLIALAIVAISLAAFVRLTSQTTSNLGRVERKALATLSAQNSLQDLRIDAATTQGRWERACPQGDLPLVCVVTVGPSQGGLHRAAVQVWMPGDESPLLGLETLLADGRR